MAAISHEARSTAPDGLQNQLEWLLTTRGGPLWNVVQAVPPVRRFVNRALTNGAINKFPTRPHPLSTMADYTSWASLTDRTYDSRHLPPADERSPQQPPAEEVAALFNREREMKPCEKSTVLFPYFAAWFVDGFLRSERPRRDPETGEIVKDPETGEPLRDPARNESNHEIDLIQLYGLND